MRQSFFLIKNLDLGWTGPTMRLEISEDRWGAFRGYCVSTVIESYGELAACRSRTDFDPWVVTLLEKTLQLGGR